MNKRLVCVVAFALFAGVGSASRAHELECEKKAGLVKLDATGNLLLDAVTGLPMFDVAPAAVLKVDAFPAAIGFRIGVHNLAADTSVVTGVSDPLLDAVTSKATFGTLIGPGLSLAIDGRAEQVVVVTVNSQQQCLDLFKAGAMSGAPVCENVVEDRFVVRHESGSAECRAQIICAAPLPPPVCGSGQHSCSGQCVSDSSLDSCGASCTPCPAPPEHAHATCNGVACGFECETGFSLSNGACVAPPGPGPIAGPTCDDDWNGVKKLGTGLLEDTGRATALDSLCNVHFTGSLGAPLVEGGSDDAFLATLDRNGVRSRTLQFGAAANDQGRGVSVDAAGNRYVLWSSFAVDPPSQTSQVTKFDPAGNSLWTKSIGDPARRTSPFGIVADAAGNTYAVGDSSGSPDGGGPDGFVTKLDPLGNEVWTRFMDSSKGDIATAVALDHKGDVYVAGVAFVAAAGAGSDAFLAKLDDSGNVLWMRLFGGPGDQQANGVGVDADGNAYVGGITEVVVGGVPTHDGAVFLAKYDSSGSQSWIQQFRSDSFLADGRAVAVDAAGNAWIAGTTAGSLPGQTELGDGDAFLAKYDTAGTRLWIRQFGTTGNDSAEGVAVDAAGNAFVTGRMVDDAFVAKFDPEGNPK